MWEFVKMIILQDQASLHEIIVFVIVVNLVLGIYVSESKRWFQHITLKKVSYI